VKLPRFLRLLLGQSNRRKIRRSTTIAKIEGLGFRVDDLGGWHDGKFASRRYRLIDPSGRVLDNGGEGFASSFEAYKAAQEALKEQGS